jgi:hypothetical protein
MCVDIKKFPYPCHRVENLQRRKFYREGKKKKKRKYKLKCKVNAKWPNIKIGSVWEELTMCRWIDKNKCIFDGFLTYIYEAMSTMGRFYLLPTDLISFP